MTGYVNYGDDQTYLFNFRMTHVQFEYVSDKIAEVVFLKDSMHSAHSFRLFFFLGDSSLQPPAMCWSMGVPRVITSNLRQKLRVSGKELWRHGCMSSQKGSWKCWARTICTTCHLQHVTYRSVGIFSQRGEGSPASPKLLTAHTFHSIQSPAPTSICTKILKGGSVYMFSPM